MSDKYAELNELINGLTAMADDYYTTRTEKEELLRATEILRNLRSAIKFCAKDDKNKHHLSVLNQLLRERKSDNKLVAVGGKAIE